MREKQRKDMEQEHLRKKIIKYTAVLVLISAVILVSSTIVVVAVRKAEERSYTAYVDSLVNEYRLRFQEQMSTDFEMLQILEALMEKGLLSREMVIAVQWETERLLAQDTGYCVAALNFRHFQYINDIFGKDQADELLVETAALLKRLLKKEERCCREKPDQFYLLLGETEEERIRERLHGIMEQISGLAANFHKNYAITLYCGVAVEQEPQDREELGKRLLAHSEFAMKMIRNGHESEIAFYDQKMHEEKQMNVMIESSRQEALENGEFHLYLQAKKLLFYQEDYVDRLCEITDHYRVPRKYLVLEILEGLAAENLEELNRTILRLKEKDFQISMDDFGSGYSSLNILSGLEIDEVKLDREFLMAMGTNREAKQKTMMRNVVQIAKDIGIRTVAEGVETEADEKFLQSIGCNYGQGYYYSRPVPAAEFGERFLHGDQ